MALPAKTTAIGIFGRWDQQRTERLTITGEQAKYLLDHHMPMNRPRTPGHVTRLEAALRDGHWKFNGECIIFDRHGELKNGQHRLTACANTGIPIDTNVAFGVEPEVFDTIDRVKPRNLGDDLHLEGETGCLNLASVLRLVYAYECGERTQSIMSTDADSITLREFLATRPHIRASALAGNAMTKKAAGYIPVTPRIIGTAHHLFGEKSPEARDRFFESFRSGEGLLAGNPILALRNRLFLDRADSGGRVQRGEGSFMQFNLLIRVWNMVRQGRSITKIQMPYHVLKDKKVPDPLPEII